MYFEKIQMHGVALALAAAFSLLGFISAQAVGSKDLFRCRQSCYQKVGSLQISRLFLRSGVKGETFTSAHYSLFTQKLKSTKFDDTNERHRRHMNTRIYPMPLLLPPIVCDINYKLCSPKTIKNMNIHKQQNATNIKEDSRSHLNRSLHIHIGVWVMPGSVDHA